MPEGITLAKVVHRELRFHSHTQVGNLKKRGMEFLDIPDAYYNQLRKRLTKSKVKVVEDIDELQKLKILIDYDDNGYLLQVRRFF